MALAPVLQSRPLTTTKPAALNSDGLYIPPLTTPSVTTQRRIAIIGAPGSGKTHSALTFPNRFWLDFDNKLPANEPHTAPFWSPEFCDSLAPRTFDFANRADATKIWLNKNIQHFTSAQTLILDSWSMSQNAFDKEYLARADNNSNDWWFPKQKKKYAREVCESLKESKALVVVLFHEVPKWENGKPSGKLGPVMDGSFQNEIFGFFTDVWHQVANVYVRDDKGKLVKDPEGGYMVKSVKHNGNDKWVWFWKLVGDDTIDLNLNPELAAKVKAKNISMIPADYNEVLKLYQFPTP